MEAGEPVTRVGELTALGQIETQLPTIEAAEVDGLNIYADMPELSRVIEADGIRGVRKDQFAIIGLVGGELELPQLDVPWWDTEAGEWRVATLPARTLTVAGAASPPVLEEPPAAVAPAQTVSPVQGPGAQPAVPLAATTVAPTCGRGAGRTLDSDTGSMVVVVPHRASAHSRAA